MTVRDHLGRSLAVGGALAVLGAAGALTLSERALAVAPPATAGATGANLTVGSAVDQNNKAVGPVAATVTTSTITVPESAQSYLRDVDVRTFLTHSASGDLRIELISPARAGQPSKTVTLVRPGGAGGSDNVFNGTLWDDSSATLATDLNGGALGEDAPQAGLAPEGSLGAFVGIDPRGVWTLRVTDTVDAPEDGDPMTPPPDGGTLASWALDLATQNAAPAVAPVITATSTPGAVTVADAATTTSNITVSGAKNYLTDVDLLTNISHSEPGDLEIRLSHGGREAVIATRVNGGTPFYSNKTFDDNATTSILDATDSAATVIPEGALAAFRGVDPNGVWTLSITDAAPGDSGTLNSWQLKIGAGDAAATPPGTSPGTTPGTTPVPVTPPVAKLGVKKFTIAKNTKKRTLTLNLGWANGTGRVNYTATLSTKLGRKAVKKVVKGSALAGPRTVKRTVSVPRAWVGKKVTVRVVLKNGATTITRSKILPKF